MDKTKLEKLCKQTFVLPFVIDNVGKAKTVVKVELKTPRTSDNRVYRTVKYWSKKEFNKMSYQDMNRHLTELLDKFLVGMIDRAEKK